MIPVYHRDAQTSPAVEDALCHAWMVMRRQEGFRPMMPEMTPRTPRDVSNQREKRETAILAALAKGDATAAELAETVDLTPNATRICLSGLSILRKIRNVDGRKTNIIWGLAR